MHFQKTLATAFLVCPVSAIPAPNTTVPRPTHKDVNPFQGKTYFANPYYAAELNETITSFMALNDTLNAARVRTLQKTGTFVWITTVSGLSLLNDTINAARKVQRHTHRKQIVELVLYNLPDRDCSAGASSGEFTLEDDGLNKYKHDFVDPYARMLKEARDLSFAVVLEPDSLGNVITNQNVPLCANASAGYEEGIAYAIAMLQSSNVALYIDAAHGGWLGWDANLPLAAAEFAKVVQLASNFTSSAKIRGFSTDVSNFNPYIADPRANYTQYNNAFDELDYAMVLAPYLTNVSLPAHFIIDQGRSGRQNTRTTWGDWCNVEAGYGVRPTTKTNSTLVDSIVWVKPGGESDGPCGPTVDEESAPNAGQWWNKYVMELVKNADPPLPPTWR